MLQSIIRTPRWLATRLALAVTILALTLGVLGSAPSTSQAHTGTPGTLCGSVDIPPVAVYTGQFNFNGRNWHTWEFPGPSFHAEDCGPV